jgi:hypothetical protein
MITKMFEVRDGATFIPTIAIKPIELDFNYNSPECFLWSRAGFGKTNVEFSKYVLFGHLRNKKLTWDPFDWDDWDSRTMMEAHKYLIEHFDELENGAVIDVEYILGETNQPKISEKFQK